MTQTTDQNSPPQNWQPPTPAPHAKKKHPVIKTLVVLAVLGFLAMGACAVALGGAADQVKNDQLKTEATVPVSPGSAPAAKNDGVSLAEFNKVDTGMSYAQVSGILGSGGTENSRTDIGGSTTVMYTWQGSGFASNMNAMFQDDVLVSKAQFGLK